MKTKALKIIISTLAATTIVGTASASTILAVSTNTTASAQTYTVQKGDSLWKIAKNQLGSGLRYKQIFDANRNLLENPNQIQIGQVLQIPGVATTNEASKTPTEQEIKSKIVGKWKVFEKEGKEYLTNKKVVLTFNDKGECTHSFARDLDPFDDYFWINKSSVPYQVKDNLVSLSYANDPDYKMMTYVIDNISDDLFSYDEKIITQTNNEAFSMMGNHIYKRVTADYSQDIIGLWEGVEMTGYETYDNAEHRIEYHADGTYTYFVKDGDNWVKSANVDNEYNVDGDWIATRWRPTANDDFNYEWWDIDEIKDGIMKWSALREKEDGTRFTTTFTWKKIS